MKTLRCLTSIFFMLVFTAATQAQAGWFLQQSGTQNKLNSAHFLNSLTGWTVGFNEIRMTTDGGMNWMLQADFSGAEDQDWFFNSVYFVNPLTGWVAGEYVITFPWCIQADVIYTTTNGGMNWSQQYIANNEMGLNSVYFMNAATGWSVGGGKILSTINGGMNWTPHVYVGCENCNWTFNSVYFTNSTNGWVIAKLYSDPPGIYSNVILKTTDGGLSLSPQYWEGGYGLTAVYFMNSTTGWSVGGDRSLKTTNGGINWILQSQFGTEHCDYYFNSIYFINSLTGWIAGELFMSPPGSYYNVIFNTTNGGLNWSQQYSSIGTGLTFIYFANSTTGWSVGNAGIILKTTNGGVTFINEVSAIIPDKYELSQNYPNPFNPVTKIVFALPKSGDVKLTVFDVLGREVAILVNENLNPGTYEVEWNALNYPSGVYFYRIKTNEAVEVRKMVLAK